MPGSILAILLSILVTLATLLTPALGLDLGYGGLPGQRTPRGGEDSKGLLQAAWGHCPSHNPLTARVTCHVSRQRVAALPRGGPGLLGAEGGFLRGRGRG